MTAARTDEELFSAYVGGDRAAFRELFQRYAPVLQRMMQRGLRSDSEVQDLVQQTFLQLHRARHDFEASRRLKPWLFTIAMNLKRQHLRKLKRRKEDPSELEDHVVPTVAAHDATRTEDVRQVREALSKLPESQREVIELHWLEGIPMAEVGDIVGASRSAVKVRAHRGYERLRKILSSMMGNQPGGAGIPQPGGRS